MEGPGWIEKLVTLNRPGGGQGWSESLDECCVEQELAKKEGVFLGDKGDVENPLPWAPQKELCCLPVGTEILSSGYPREKGSNLGNEVGKMTRGIS